MWSPPLHLLSLCCSQLQALPGCTLCWGQGAAAGDSRGGHGGSRQGTRCCRCLGGRGHEGDRGSWSLLSPLGPQSRLSRGQSRQAQRCGDTARNAATGPPVWSLFGPLPALVGLGVSPWHLCPGSGPLLLCAIPRPGGRRGDPWARARARCVASEERAAGHGERGGAARLPEPTPAKPWQCHVLIHLLGKAAAPNPRAERGHCAGAERKAVRQALGPLCP